MPSVEFFNNIGALVPDRLRPVALNSGLLGDPAATVAVNLSNLSRAPHQKECRRFLPEVTPMESIPGHHYS